MTKSRPCKINQNKMAKRKEKTNSDQQSTSQNSKDWAIPTTQNSKYWAIPYKTLDRIEKIG